MHNCPTDLELAQLAEGVLSGRRADAVARHALQCEACAQTLSILGDVMVQGNDLPDLSVTEREQAADALQRVMNGQEMLAPESTNETEHRPLISRVYDGLFAGMMAGDTLFPSGAMPALGQTAEKNDDLDVRNTQAQDSSLDKGAWIDDGSVSHDAERITMEDRTAMQESIERVFYGGDDTTVGLDAAPGLYSPEVQQGYTNTCAIRCQEIIMRDYGLELSEEDLVRMASVHGWYDPEFGTFAADVGMLMESQGIDTNTYEKATIFQLTNELAQGHRVIVAVDSGELWQRNSIYMELMERMEDITEGERPDHAVLVSGVDVSDPNHPMVIVTDPGTGEVAAEYPLDQFLNAWEDSGFHMVATADAPPQFALEHVHTIGELPYDRFAAWYPSVEHLTGFEPFFDQCCGQFEQVLHTAGILPLPDMVADSACVVDFVSVDYDGDVDGDGFFDFDDDDDEIDWS